MAEINHSSPKSQSRGHESITQLLLDTETDTSPCHENKETSLHKACERGLESIVFFLFDQGADINFLTIRNKLLYIKPVIREIKAICTFK